MHARTLALLTSLLAGLPGGAARADAPPSEVKPAEPPAEETQAPTPAPPTHVHEARPIPDEPNWQLGAGVNLGTSNAGTVINPNGLGSAILVPSATVAVERRLGASTWLGLGATVSYAHNSSDEGQVINPGGGSSGGTVTTDASVYGATASLRQILNLHDLVELSVLADVFAGYGYTISDNGFPSGFGTTNVQTAKLKTLTAGLGLVVAAEKELTSRLALRLSLHVLGLQYTHAGLDNSSSSDPSTVSSTAGSSFSLGLDPSASLTLRFLF